MSTRMLAALTTALVLTLAVAGAVTSIAGHGTAAGAHPAQATPPGPTEWNRVDLRSFAVWLPPGWTYEYREGVDSFVGAFVGDGAELVFDYGVTSDPMPDPGTQGYDVTNETIGGKPAKLVVARSAPADLTGVYFADVTRERAGCEHVIVDTLIVVGRDLDAEQQATALAILRSIHFPGPGEWTRVPVPAYPDTLSMSLWDIDMVSADEGWAVGAQYDLEAEAHAAVLHYRDGHWRALRSPSQDILMSVDMVSAGEGWAVGSESIVHYKDGEWKLLKDKAPFMVLDVEMVSPDDGWIVGTDALLRYRDGQWQPQDTPEYRGAVRLNMLSPDEGWSLGGTKPDFAGPNFHRFENGAWRSVPWPLPTLSDPQALEMTANPWGTGWLGGGGDDGRGWLARHCEGRYEPVTTTLPSTVWDIDMLHASGTEGWAVGGDASASPALLMHFDNDEWTVLDSPYDGLIKAVDMVGRDEGWAVGMYFGPDIMGGALLHYTGSQPPPPPGSTATATATATPTRDAATATPSPTDTPTPPNGRAGIYLPVVSKAHDWAPIRLRGESTGIAAVGDFVYMGDGTHVAVVDVSNPSRPWVTGRVGPLGHDCAVFDVAAEGDFVYATCLDWSALPDMVDDKTTVAVLRAATANQPAAVASTLRIKEVALDLSVKDGWIYVGGWWCGPNADCEGDRRGGVVVIDASDPTSLSYTNFVPVNARCSADLLVDDGHLYVAGGYPDPASGLDGPVISVLDLSIPEAPEPVADIAVHSVGEMEDPWVSALARHAGLLYAVPGLSVFDTRVPSEPEHLADLRFADHFGPMDVEAGGKHVYLVAHVDDPQLFQVIEPLDPATPPGSTIDAAVVGQVALPGYVTVARNVEDLLAADGDHVYVARGFEVGLYVIDVHDPANPEVVGALDR